MLDVLKLALSAMAVWLAACGDDGSSAISQTLEASRRVLEKVCECSDESDCSIDEDRVACAEGVLNRHADELEAFAQCANDAYVELEACIDAADCSESIISDCFSELEPGVVCEPVPEALDEAIDSEIGDACPEDLDCSDGTTARGAYCDGDTECADGSDEDFCEDDEPQFTCDNGTQVPASWVCDGTVDCRDSSDEDATQCMSQP